MVPYLRSIQQLSEHTKPGEFPFTIGAFAKGIDLHIDSPVTFFVGENGSGKSTLLEAIADKVGFSQTGGNRNHLSVFANEPLPLTRALRLGWTVKATRGFFLRAESFFDFATSLDEMAAEYGPEETFEYYGGQSLHRLSHGESFLALFQHKFRDGLFLLDEPEAALSPMRQLALLTIIHDLVGSGAAQFLIASHSPLLFSYPGAAVLQFDEDGIRPVPYQETEHYQLTRRFLENPARYFRYLFAE